MPNWTSNRIKFNSVEDLQRVLLFTRSSDDMIFDFNRIMPEPCRVEDCPQQFILRNNSNIKPEGDRPWFNWYSWHNMFWGTKWNACDPYMTVDGKGIGFDTAWSSPTPIFLKIADVFRDTPFTADSFYEEGGATHYIYSGDGSGDVQIEDGDDECIRWSDEGECSDPGGLS